MKMSDTERFFEFMEENGYRIMITRKDKGKIDDEHLNETFKNLFFMMASFYQMIREIYDIIQSGSNVKSSPTSHMGEEEK